MGLHCTCADPKHNFGRCTDKPSTASLQVASTAADGPLSPARRGASMRLPEPRVRTTPKRTPALEVTGRDPPCHDSNAELAEVSLKTSLDSAAAGLHVSAECSDVPMALVGNRRSS